MRTAKAMVCVVVLVAVAAAWADVPAMVNYQGKLTDSAGKPITGQVGVTFRIYDTPGPGGTVLWQESQFVSPQNGIFHILLGSGAPLTASVFAAPDRYLELQVGRDAPMTPRERIASVAYSMQADKLDGQDSSAFALVSHTHPAGGNADTLDGLDSSQFLRKDISDATSGHLTANWGLEGQGHNGSLGIPTPFPPTPGVTGYGTAGGLSAFAAPGILAVGGAGTMLGQADIALEAQGDVDIITHDTQGVRMEPGDGSWDNALHVSGYGADTARRLVGVEGGLEVYRDTVGSSFHAESTHPNGVALTARVVSTDPCAVLTNEGTGDVLKLCSGPKGYAELVRVPNDGNAQFYNGAQVHRNAAAVPGTALFTENSHASGIALTAVVDSSDTCSAFTNHGIGDIIRGFNDPDYHNLVFRVTNSGAVEVRQDNDNVGPAAYFYRHGFGDIIRATGVWEGNTVFRVTGAGEMEVNSQAGGLMENAAVKVTNDGNGPALYATGDTPYSTGIFINEGTGDVLRCYGGPLGQDMRFSVSGSGITTCWGELHCRELAIFGGGDIAEPFQVSDGRTIQPGMVVAIDPEHPGKLRLSDRPYDRTVAGIVSGANGIKPGLTMKQEGTQVDGSLPVALTGRVYCWCDATGGPIQPGDLLTTSDRPGHAMKVTDHAKAQGAILGKAMQPLDQGKTGQILVLVTLQ